MPSLAKKLKATLKKQKSAANSRNSSAIAPLVGWVLLPNPILTFDEYLERTTPT